jgi:predicted esterase
LGDFDKFAFMKKFGWFVAICILSAKVFAGDNVKERYKDVVFSQVSKDSVQYCVADHHCLMMDVYKPAGDTLALRPLVIFAHGGSFMHGDRYSDRLPAICTELAQRGYVAVSMEYRLTNLLGMASKAAAYKEIIKSIADGRSCIAWFLNDIVKGNTYRIDKSRIFFGGNSAGAILAEQLAFIDSAARCKPLLQKIVKKYLPDSGALPPHAIRGIISLAGAILDTNLILPGHPPLLHIQGDADHIVQYGYKRAVNGLAPFKMAGLGASRPRYISQHMDYTEYVFKNAGHTPWDYDDNAHNIVMHRIIDFLSKEMK